MFGYGIYFLPIYLRASEVAFFAKLYSIIINSDFMGFSKYFTNFKIWLRCSLEFVSVR